MSDRPSEETHWSVDDLAFEIEQELLTLQATRVSGKFAGAAYDPVARDQDAQRVAADGCADFLWSRPICELAGEVPVGRGFTVRDLADETPHLLLEFAPISYGGQVKLTTVAVEILG